MHKLLNSPPLGVSVDPRCFKPETKPKPLKIVENRLKGIS